LPDVDLNIYEYEENEETEKENEDDEDDDELLPLDFRTSMIEGENRVVIQAKPLSFKTDEEFMRDLEN